LLKTPHFGQASAVADVAPGTGRYRLCNQMRETIAAALEMTTTKTSATVNAESSGPRGFTIGMLASPMLLTKTLTPTYTADAIPAHTNPDFRARRAAMKNQIATNGSNSHCNIQPPRYLPSWHVTVGPL
jgi:hypothetical protein